MHKEDNDNGTIELVELTEEEWERAEKATLEILGYIELEEFEALAKKMNDPTFRGSPQYKQFIKTLQKQE